MKMILVIEMLLFPWMIKFTDILFYSISFIGSTYVPETDSPLTFCLVFNYILNMIVFLIMFRKEDIKEAIDQSNFFVVTLIPLGLTFISNLIFYSGLKILGQLIFCLAISIMMGLEIGGNNE